MELRTAGQRTLRRLPGNGDEGYRTRGEAVRAVLDGAREVPEARFAYVFQVLSHRRTLVSMVPLVG